MTTNQASNVSSNRPLAGKIAIVTGSSRGIGRATAQRLGKDGATVVVTYLTNSALAEEVVQEIKENQSEAIALQVNIQEVESVRRLFEKVLAHFGKFDILINNAYRSGILKPTSEMTLEDYDQMFSYTRGVYFAMQEASRHMTDGGRIINISTAITTVNRPTGGAYAGSKAAIEQFSFSLAKEVGTRGITVNVVSPGVTTGMSGNYHHPLAPNRPLGSDPSSPVAEIEPSDRRLLEQIVAFTPIGRLGTPEDIADVVALLVTDDARWITGQNVRAAGGFA